MGPYAHCQPSTTLATSTGARPSTAAPIPVRLCAGLGRERGAAGWARSGAARLFVNRDYALLWLGRTVSNLGDWVFVTSVTLWIATGLARDQTWAPLAVGGAGLAVAIPTIVAGPLAGVFVDRWDKRRTMLAADGLRAGLMAVLLAIVVAGGGLPASVELGLLYAVIVLETICATLFGPAQLAVIGMVVDAPRLPQAASMTQFGVYLGLVLGPPLAAPLYFAGGIGWALAVNGLSFLGSFAAVRAVGHRAPAAAGSAASRWAVLSELREGLGFVAGQPTLRVLLITVVIVTAGTGALNALNIFFLRTNLHAPAELYGTLSAALALGALVGAPLSGLVARRLAPARLFSLSLLVLGLLVLGYSRLTAFVPALVVLFLLGLPQVALNVAVTPMLLAVTPPRLVGRVGATIPPAASAAMVGGVALAGYLASTVLRDLHARVGGVAVGTNDAIFGAASLLIIGAGAYAVLGFRRPAATALEPATTD
jgi:MFS family permease